MTTIVLDEYFILYKALPSLGPSFRPFSEGMVMLYLHSGRHRDTDEGS